MKHFIFFGKWVCQGYWGKVDYMCWLKGYPHFSIRYTRASWTDYGKMWEKKRPNNSSTHQNPHKNSWKKRMSKDVKGESKELGKGDY